MKPDESVLEGIVTTINEDGSTNIAPMGPIVDVDMSTLRLRPYQTSTTYANLKRTEQGIFHVTDDVFLIARAAVNCLDPLPPLVDCRAVEGRILSDACRWYAFRVEVIDDRQERTDITARVVDRGRLRDFFGFNRAKHAVLEAAILATRIGFVPPDTISSQLDQLAITVEKTAGERERQAFQFLEDYVHRQETVASGSTPAAVSRRTPKPVRQQPGC